MRHRDCEALAVAHRGSLTSVRSRDGQRRAAGAPVGEVPLETVTTLERTGEWVEILIYIAGGSFLLAAAVIVLADAVPALWRGASPSARASLILDRVLLVFVPGGRVWCPLPAPLPGRVAAITPG